MKGRPGGGVSGEARGLGGRNSSKAAFRRHRRPTITVDQSRVNSRARARARSRSRGHVRSRMQNGKCSKGASKDSIRAATGDPFYILPFCILRSAFEVLLRPCKDGESGVASPPHDGRSLCSSTFALRRYSADPGPSPICSSVWAAKRKAVTPGFARTICSISA